MVIVVNFNMGNLGSVLNMLRKVGADAIISSRKDEIRSADKLILPGVGAFDTGMNNLRDLDLVSVLTDLVLEQSVPILGICLGMQLFTLKSEEGKTSGLGLLDAETVRFDRQKIESGLKIPHMGWNSVKLRKLNALLPSVLDSTRFYFVHSYHVVCFNEEDILAETEYGYRFVSAVSKENIYGVQFHPEKSHKYGMEVLRNFLFSV